MSKASDTAAFLEVHFYRGGLRTEFVGNGAERPSWAPPFDWVGFRDEISLAGGDLVVELAKFSVGASIVSWVGVYRHSPDEVYGDRKNHLGVGVWLRDFAPSEPSLLVAALESLLEVFQESAQAGLEAKGRAFLNEYLGKVATHYTELPPPLGGLLPATGPALETSTYVLQNGREDKDTSIDGILLRLFYLSPANPSSSRALVLIGTEQTAQAAVGKGFQPVKPLRLGAELLGGLPKAFSKQRQLTAGLEGKLALEAQKADRLDETIDKLQTELSAARERATVLQRECAELRSSMEGNTDLQRHAAIVQRLSEQTSQITDLSRNLAALRPQLVREVTAELRKSSPSDPLPIRAPRAEIQTSASYGRQSTRGQAQNFDPDWIKIVALSILAIEIAGGLIWAAVHYYPYGL